MDSLRVLGSTEVHDAAKYIELHRRFLDAAAEFDQLHFRASIEASKASEESTIRHGRYDIPCHTSLPYSPWRECAVLVPCGGEMEEPFSILKTLSASAWLWLPNAISEAFWEWIPEWDATQMRMHYQPWISLLWARDFVEGHELEPHQPGCAGVDMDPFTASASLIRDWRLASDEPAAPEFLFLGTSQYERRTDNATSRDQHDRANTMSEKTKPERVGDIRADKLTPYLISGRLHLRWIEQKKPSGERLQRFLDEVEFEEGMPAWHRLRDTSRRTANKYGYNVAQTRQWIKALEGEIEKRKEAGILVPGAENWD